VLNAHARTAVEVYPTQAARRLSRRPSPDKLVQELCAWIEAPQLSKMSTTCEDEGNSVQLASSDEFTELIVSDLDAATAAFLNGVSELSATAVACPPAPAAPVSRPGQAATALEICSFATQCKSVCCASLAPVPALAPAPTRSAGRRAMMAPIAMIVASPIAEVVDCFMAGDMTYDHRRFICAPFNGDPMTWLQFAQDFEIGVLVKYAKDDNEYNLAQTLIKGTDIGGRNNTVPLALDPDMDPAVRQERVQQERWHERRNQTLYTFVVNHVADPNLRQMLINEKPGDGVGAWEMPRTHVYREPDDFALSVLETQYAHMNYVTCGFDKKITAVADFVAALNTFNLKLPLAHRKSASEIALKVLISFEKGSPIGLQAAIEVANKLLSFAPVPPSTECLRDLTGVMVHFGMLWTSQHQDTQGAGVGHQADGAYYGEVDQFCNDIDSAFAVGFGGGKGGRGRGRGVPAQLRPGQVRSDARLSGPCLTIEDCRKMGIRRCSCCQGFGHESQDCGNPVDVKINMETARQLHADQLHAYADRRGTGPGAPPRQPYPPPSSRGSGGGGGGRGRGDRRVWDNEPGEQEAEDDGENEAHYIDGGPSHYLGSFEIVSNDAPFGDRDEAFFADTPSVQFEPEVIDMLATDIDVPIDPPVQPEMLDEMLDVVLDGVGSVQPRMSDVVLDDAGHVQHKMLDEVLDNVVDRDVNAHGGDIDEHAAEVWASFMSNIRAV